MKKRNLKRIFAAFMATSLVVSCTACGEKKEEPKDSGSTTTTDAPTEEAVKDVDLGGIVVYIRDWWTGGSTIEEPLEPSARETNSAYEKKRNAYQEEMMKKYNFKLYEVGGDDWGKTSEDFVNYVTTGGDDKNYIWTLHSDATCYNAMQQGLMADLSKIDCLDFSQDKFQRNKLHEKYSIGSSIYAFFPGFSEPRTGVYFNKKILKDAGVDPDSIYEAQKNGTWDWKMFEEIMAKCHRDTDGDGVADVYGLTLNESVMTSAAVFSNNGAYFKKENGKIIYNVESPETMEALQWCIDMYKKFDDHDPVTYDEEGNAVAASWDYYQTEWRNGQAAFLVEQEYANVQGNIFGDLKDFEIGFVMFPKGPKATTTVNVFDNNAYVIPACYVGKDVDADGHDRAWRIAFAWNVYTNPAPGEEDTNGYLDKAKTGNFDARAIKETIPMMAEPEHGTIAYHDFIAGIEMGPELEWNINAGNGDLSATIDALRDKWKAAADAANASK
jgi:ABC-type glycerol-3-phosphate transport system substrate-binding protein